MKLHGEHREDIPREPRDGLPHVLKDVFAHELSFQFTFFYQTSGNYTDNHKEGV
mgnify:CR=1 FL=1